MTLPTQALKTRDSLGSFSNWHEIVYHRLVSRYDLIDTSNKTAEAEAGLGIGSCVYWYVSRIESLYGRVLMIWRNIQPIDERVFSFSPCDTGGIWHGHIVTPFSSSDALKKQFVEDWSFPATLAIPVFQEWLAEVFPIGSREYVAGSLPPAYLVHNDFEPFDNGAPAWSWEMRAPKTLDLSRDFTIDSIFWSSADYMSFRAYLQTAVPKPLQVPLSMLVATSSHVHESLLVAIAAAREYLATRTDAECYD